MGKFPFSPVLVDIGFKYVNQPSNQIDHPTTIITPWKTCLITHYNIIDTSSKGKTGSVTSLFGVYITINAVYSFKNLIWTLTYIRKRSRFSVTIIIGIIIKLIKILKKIGSANINRCVGMHAIGSALI